jgi:ribonuclease BN (tRNA processing enzyme)
VAYAVGDDPPTLVVDAGTGLPRLDEVLQGAPFSGSVLLSHLHWDHTHGIPFSRTLDHPDAVVDLFLPAQGVPPEELLARALSPPHFPIGPDGLLGRWRFHLLEPGTHEISGFAVTAEEVPHKGGRNFGYRIEADGAAVAHISDHAPGPVGSGPLGLGEVGHAVRRLAADADLLLHDSQHTAAEWPELAFLGHATVEYAVDLAERSGSRRLALFHHDPRRTDDALDAMVGGIESSVPVVAAAAGQSHDL